MKRIVSRAQTTFARQATAWCTSFSMMILTASLACQAALAEEVEPERRDANRSQAVPVEPDGLWPLVSPDVALVAEVRNLRSEWELRRSEPFFKRLASSPLAGKFLLDRNVRAVREGVIAVQRATGKPPLEVLLTACAKHLVSAIFVKPGQEPEGVLLALGDSTNSAKDLLELWKAVDQEAQYRQKEYRGTAFWERTERGSSIYIATLGSITVITDKLPQLNTVIDRHLAPAVPPANVPVGAAVGTGRELGQAGDSRKIPGFHSLSHQFPETAVARVWLFSRQWDHLVIDRAGTAKRERAAELMRDLWQKYDGWGLSLRLDDGLVLDVLGQVAPAEKGRGWHAPAAQESANESDWRSVWASESDRAAVWLRGRFDTKTLWSELLLLSEPKQKQELIQLDRLVAAAASGIPMHELIATIAGNWAAVIQLEPLSPSTSGPVSGQFLSSSAATKRNAKLATATTDLVRVSLQLVSGAINIAHPDAVATALSTSTSKPEGTTQFVLARGEVRVAEIIVTDDQVSAKWGMATRSSPTTTPVRAAERQSAAEVLCDRFSPGCVQAVCINTRRFRDWLRTEGPGLVEQLAETKPERRDMTDKLVNLEGLLDLADWVFLTAGTDEATLRITGGIALGAGEAR